MESYLVDYLDSRDILGTLVSLSIWYISMQKNPGQTSLNICLNIWYIIKILSNLRKLASILSEYLENIFNGRKSHHFAPFFQLGHQLDGQWEHHLEENQKLLVDKDGICKFTFSRLKKVEYKQSKTGHSRPKIWVLLPKTRRNKPKRLLLLPTVKNLTSATNLTMHLIRQAV